MRVKASRFPPLGQRLKSKESQRQKSSSLRRPPQNSLPQKYNARWLVTSLSSTFGHSPKVCSSTSCAVSPVLSIAAYFSANTISIFSVLFECVLDLTTLPSTLFSALSTDFICLWWTVVHLKTVHVVRCPRTTDLFFSRSLVFTVATPSLLRQSRLRLLESLVLNKQVRPAQTSTLIQITFSTQPILGQPATLPRRLVAAPCRAALTLSALDTVLEVPPDK